MRNIRYLNFFEDISIIRDHSLLRIKIIGLIIIFFLVCIIQEFYSNIVISIYYVLMPDFFINIYLKINAIIKKYKKNQKIPLNIIKGINFIRMVVFTVSIRLFIIPIVFNKIIPERNYFSLYCFYEFMFTALFFFLPYGIYYDRQNNQPIILIHYTAI